MLLVQVFALNRYTRSRKNMVRVSGALHPRIVVHKLCVARGRGEEGVIG